MTPELQNNPQAVEEIVKNLHKENLLSDEQERNVRSELERQSPLYAALSLHGDETIIWQHFAKQRGMTFYPRHQELRVFMSDMMKFSQVVELGILPHRPKIPFSETVTYHIDIEEQPAISIAGSRARYSLIPPSVFRYLYDMAYPEIMTGKLSREQARALVTFTREGTWEQGSPEQEAEITALARGYKYIDIRRDPPEEEVRNLISMNIKARMQCYPHHMTGTHLIVMMQNPENAEHLQIIERHTQMKIQPVISTLSTILQLIQTENDENERGKTLISREVYVAQ